MKKSTNKVIIVASVILIIIFLVIGGILLFKKISPNNKEGEYNLFAIVKEPENHSYKFDYGEDNSIIVYKYENSSYKEVNKILIPKEFDNHISYDGDGTVTYLQYVNEKNEEKILGIVEQFFEDDPSQKYCPLEGKCLDLDFNLYGDWVRLSSDDPYTTYNSKYVIVAKENSQAQKYGLLNLETLEIVIDFQYDHLYSTHDGHFIAEKNGKVGIIDETGKTTVNFQYDFIDREDNAYIVSKNNKLAIMDENYNLITKFIFDYLSDDYFYYLCCGNMNSISLYTSENGYILSNTDDIRLEYANRNIYYIDKEGNYQTFKDIKNYYQITNDLFVIRYQSDQQNLYVYNSEMKEKYTISNSQEDNYFNVINNTLIIDKDNYYDIKTGKLLDDIPNYDFHNITIKYNIIEDQYSNFFSVNAAIYVDNKVFLNDIDAQNIKFKEDGSFTINNGNKYYEVRKPNKKIVNASVNNFFYQFIR